MLAHQQSILGTEILPFKRSATQSTIISACASSIRFFPAKLNSLAKNLAMVMDCEMVVPLYSNIGSVPVIVSKIILNYYVLNIVLGRLISCMIFKICTWFHRGPVFSWKSIIFI